MNRRSTWVACCLLVLAGSSLSFAQQAAPASPEFDRLKQMDGTTWDAVGKAGDADVKGSATCKLDLGGRWMVYDFNADIGGQKFSSRVFNTYDLAKKKYVSVTMTSLRDSALTTEGNYDADGKVLTMRGEGALPDGKKVKLKTATEFKDADSLVYTESIVGEDGNETVVGTYNFKRRK